MSQSNDDNILFLKDLDIYEGISEKVICRIAPTSFEENFKKGTQIYTPHEPDQNIYSLKHGEIILYHSKDGKRAIFDTLGPGAVFGNFDPGQTHPTHFAETTKSTLLCVTPMSEFLQIVQHRPEIMLNLMQKMASRIQDYETKIRSNIETASERVYSELERLQKKRQQGFMGKFMPVPLQITHEKLAQHTNLNRVTVTRSLKKLKEEGLISIDSKGVIELVEQQ
ncbi:MAG: Crp/Fnr family transcriptional regulator [Candidatus Peregrinibacteria bacterium]|nr:Crp/Fnr family transcriptional regulator [Candidatus Peregrinibacteria bacterium]